MKTNLSLLVLSLLAASAQAHVHWSVGVDAAGTGLQFVLYGDDTKTVTADGHYASTDGQPVVTTLNSTAVAAPFAGFATGRPPTLTSDYYSSGVAVAPAAWSGVDVWLEFASVTPVAGTTRTDNVVGFSVPQGDFNYQDAISSGATLADRGIDLGDGNHFHGVSLYSQFGGTYDVSVVAHDLRGTGTALTASTPLLLRIDAVPEPASLTLLGLAGATFLRRRRSI